MCDDVRSRGFRPKSALKQSQMIPNVQNSRDNHRHDCSCGNSESMFVVEV